MELHFPREGQHTVSFESESGVTVTVEINTTWPTRIGSIGLALPKGEYEVHGRLDYSSIDFGGFHIRTDELVTQTVVIPPSYGSTTIYVVDPNDNTTLRDYYGVTIIDISDGSYTSCHLRSPYEDTFCIPVREGSYVAEFNVFVDGVPTTVWSHVVVEEKQQPIQLHVPSAEGVGYVTAALTDAEGRPVSSKFDTVMERIEVPGIGSIERPLGWVINEFGNLATYVAAGHHHWVIRHDTYEEHVEFDVTPEQVVDLGTIVVGPEPEPPAPEPQPEPVPSPTPEPAPVSPPVVPQPQPGGPPEFEIAKDTLNEQGDAADGVITLQVPQDRLVAIRPEVRDVLEAEGHGLHLVMGEVAVTLDASFLALERWADADGAARVFLDGYPEGAVRFRLAVDPVQLHDAPADLVPAGPAYRLRWQLVGADGRLVEPARWPNSLWVSFALSGTEDEEPVAVWPLDVAGDATAQPSWARGDVIHFSAQRPGTYIAAVRPARFQDTAGHWAREAIATAYSHGIVRGLDQAGTRFEPGRPVTRLEFAAMIGRTLGLEPDPAGAEAFTDVRHTWAAGLVGAVQRAGVTQGIRQGYFGAGETLTRLQLAVMLGRALEAQGVSAPLSEQVLERFRDREEIPNWAERPLATAVAAGVARGDGTGRLNPHLPATRAETAVMLIRFLRAWLDAVPAGLPAAGGNDHGGTSGGA